jgi:2-hydroxychromene-2-carboxylate isomerase
MNNEQIYRRQQEFSDLRDLVYNNSVVSHYVAMYVHGQIVSKDECLFQIIRELAKTRDELIRRATDEAMMQSTMKIYEQQRDRTEPKASA